MLTKMPSHFDLKLIDMGERIAGKQDRPSLNAYNNFYSRTPKQTPHFDTRSEINPSRTLVKNEIMKTFKSAQNIGNRARKCVWHCFSCEMVISALVSDLSLA